MSAEKTENFGTEKIKKISQFRTALPQFLACTAENLVLLELAMAVQFSTTVIPVLLEAKTGLKFTTEEASWFGSTIFICQPVGSIMSGFMSEVWGRKFTLVLVNFPFFLGWMLMYTAYELYQLFIAQIVLGLSIGFTEAPLSNYIGEISQPKWRGALMQFSQVYLGLGFFLMSLIGATTEWHMSAAISAFFPVLSAIVIFFMPESPAWLFTKGRKEDALKNLCWLRGWVTPEAVKEEFQDMVKYNKTSNLLKENTSEYLGVRKKILHCLGIDDLCRNEILRPLILVNIFYIFQHTAGMTGTRPYMVEIFKEFQSPMDPFWAAVINTAVGVLANVTGSLTIAKIGKRIICHISFLVGASCAFLICIYNYSFVNSNASWIPVTLYFVLNFVWSIGIGIVPWILVSEIFPIRGRSLASGMTSGFSYLICFLATKTYYDLTSAISLPGAFAFFGIMMVIGWVFFYFLIPETEGKSLEEIEIIYANVLKKQSHQCQPGKDCPRLSAIAIGNANYEITRF